MSDAVEAVFRKALAVSPQERFQTMGELWNELRGAMYAGPVPRRSASGTRAAVSAGGRPVNAPAAPIPVEPMALRPIPPTPPPPREVHVASAPPSALVAAPVARAVSHGGSAIVAATLAAVLLVGGGAAFVFFARAPAPVTPVPSASVAPILPPPSAPIAPACPKGSLLIPPGAFFMGSDDREDFEFERPAHRVVLTKPTCMDAFEATVQEYVAASEAGTVPGAGQTNEWDGITAAERRAFDPLCNARAPEDRAKHPINCVTWAMADTFCRSRAMRLPTEAEWEYAARGPDGRKYPWGDELPSASFLNACGKECVDWGKRNHIDPTGLGKGMYADDDGFPTTAPVGSFPAGKSRYGVQDVVGNVWEWVADRYAPYTADERTDPTGPEGGKERVIRGGAWNAAMAAWVRPTFRYHDAENKRSHGIGFRCASTMGAGGP